MARYLYKAKKSDGSIVSSRINASSVIEAAGFLEQRGLIILEIVEDTTVSSHLSAGQIRKTSVFSMTEKKSFIDSFYALYKSGLSVIEIFQSMYNSSRNANIKALCSQILYKVEKGISLKEAMKKSSNALGVAYTTLIAAGETSGTLDDVLYNIKKNIEREEDTKKRLISACVYPIVLITFVLFVGLFFYFGLNKIFTEIYTLSFNERISILVSAALKSLGIIILIGGIIFYLVKSKILVNRILNSQLFYNFLKNSYYGNYFSIMGLAYDAGIPSLESYSLALTVISGQDDRYKLKKVEKMIENGSKLTTAFAVTGLFSDFALTQISSGETSGELGKMYKSISEDYFSRLEQATTVFTSSLGPILMFIVAICVAIIGVQGYNSYFSGITSF